MTLGTRASYNPMLILHLKLFDGEDCWSCWAFTSVSLYSTHIATSNDIDIIN